MTLTADPTALESLLTGPIVDRELDVTIVAPRVAVQPRAQESDSSDGSCYSTADPVECNDSSDGSCQSSADPSCTEPDTSPIACGVDTGDPSCPPESADMCPA